MKRNSFHFAALLAVLAISTLLAPTMGRANTLIAMGEVNNSPSPSLTNSVNALGGTISVSRISTGVQRIRIDAPGAFAGSTTGDYVVHATTAVRDFNTRTSVVGLNADTLVVQIRVVDVESFSNANEATAQNKEFKFFIARIGLGTLDPGTRCLVAAGRIASNGDLLSFYGGEGATAESVPPTNPTGEYRIEVNKPGGYGLEDQGDFLILTSVDGSGNPDAVSRGSFSALSPEEYVLTIRTADVQSATNTTIAQDTNAATWFVVYRFLQVEAVEPASNAMLLAGGSMSEFGNLTGAASKSGYQLSGSRSDEGNYAIYIDSPGAFAGRDRYEFIPIVTISSNVDTDTIPNCFIAIENDNRLRLHVQTRDVEIDGDSNGEPKDEAFYFSLYDIRARTQTDARVGKGRNPLTHRGDDLYTPTGSGQIAPIRMKKSGRGRFFYSVENDGSITDRFGLRQTGVKRSTKTKHFDLTTGKANITSAVRTGQIVATDSRPLTSHLYECQVRPGRGSRTKKKTNLRITSNSAVANRSTDAAIARLTTKKR